MPLGLVIMNWDERVGAEIKGRYPEEIQIQDKTLMQLYSQHEFTGDAGFVTLTSGAVSIASYYTGHEKSLYIILVLTLEEDGEIYEEGLMDIATQVTDKMEEEIAEILPRLFQRLGVYPNINQEQRLSMIYNNEVKMLTIKRLREEVLFPKSELNVWLKDQYKNAFVDIENLVNELVKIGLMKIASVKGYASDLLFFTGDLVAIRIPPVNIIKNPSDRNLPDSLKSTFMAEVRNFFAQYVPDEKDSQQLIEEVILEPANYEVLKLLRQSVVTIDTLEKLKKKGVDDLKGSLKTLWSNKLINVFKDDNGIEYYCLISDFVIDRIFPRYALNTIREQYSHKVQNPNALIKALELFKEEYYAVNKKKAKAEEEA
jgi:hypothetical protein